MHISWTLFLAIFPYFPQIYFVLGLVNALYIGNEDNSVSTVNNIVSTTGHHHPKKTEALVVRFADNDTVYGIAVFENLLVTVLDNAIIIRKTTPSQSAEDVHRISLPTTIRNELLELKFVDHETLLYCDSTTCRLCFLYAVEDPCHEYVLTWNGKKVNDLVYATGATDANQNMQIRFVTDSANRAGIVRFPSLEANSRLKKLESVQSAEDIRIIDGHGLAGAFNRLGYTFFVGSARRPYEPYINARIEELITMSVRITRICDRDRTEKLESRIDMALTCGNFSLRTNVHSLAAEYDPHLDELVVVFQDAETSQNVACKYDMTLVQNTFNQIWERCQNLSYKHSAKECQKVYSSNDLPLHCFTFTRRADGHAMRTCSKFGGSYAEEPLDSCDLDSFPSSAYRYGWLEQFQALEGVLIAVLPDSDEDILSVKRFKDDGALFIVYSGATLNRVANQKYHNRSLLLWSLTLLQQQSNGHLTTPRFYVATDVSQKRIYFVQNNELKYAEFSCSFFYDSCDSMEKTAWSDPLQCRWCAMKNGSGYAFSLEHGNTCQFYLVGDLCAPHIEHVNIPSSTSSNTTLFEVYGSKFDRLRNVLAKVCDKNCVISALGSAKLSCIVDIRSEAVQGCDFYLEGTLGSAGRFNITFESLAKQQYVTNDILASTHSHYSRRTKAIVSVFVVIALVILIVFILYLLRRIHMHQRIKMKQGDRNSSQIALDASNSLYVGSNPFMDIKGKKHNTNMFSPYENLFMEIDSKLKIPPQDLEFGAEIGKGNFGVVYRAVYRCKDGRSTDVACKTIDTHNDGVVTGVSEFLREGLIMANFDHPNVARLIGISLSSNNCPIIVTDFLAKGDLRHYIINPTNRLTFGNLLDFGIQIAKGMTYLHEKNFIHRDLAARNCMLDKNLVVKIADFGLSRDVSRCGMYQAIHKDRGIPIRWMPIESLEDQQYTFKADIWAYGVVLWELATRGLIPYADLEFVDILRLLKSGHRLSKPKGCPDILYYQVMLVCWMEDPQRRPTFFELTEMMEDVVEQLRRGMSGGALLDSHYERVSPRSSATTPICYSKFSVSDPIITDL